MRKKRIWVLTLLFLPFIPQAQNYDQAINDLRQELNAHPTEDEERVDLLNDISYAYRRSSSHKVDSFAKAALQLAEELDYPKGMGIAYKNLGIATWKLGGNTEAIINFYQKCYDLAKQGDDYYSQAACSNNIGLSYRSRLQYSKAIKAFQDAREIHAAHFPVDRLRMLIIGNIGKTYVSMEDYDNAQLYLEEAISLAEKHDNQPVIAMYMENYALVKYEQGEVDESIEMLIKYLPKTKAIGDYQSYVQATATLSSILIEQQEFDRAITYLEQGLEVAEERNFPVYKCDISINRSKVLLAKNKIFEAQKIGEDAYNSAKSRLDYQQQMRAAKNLLNVYLANKNTTKAKELFPVYNDLVERHFNTEGQKTYARLEVEYQNEKKEAENALLKAQQNENEATIKAQRFIALSLLLLGLLATGGALFAYRIKRTQNDLLEKKVEERTKALNESYQKLERSNQKLEKSNEELERFAYIASHDLKQPLNTVISFSGLLKKELVGTLDSKSSTYLNFVIKGANQMKTLIEDILEYSKLSQEKREPQIIDLNLLVDEVVDSISDLIERRNAQVNIKGTLPVLRYEKTKILILFKNLIENGVQYNQSEVPTVEIQQSEYEMFTRFSFVDNGIGIERQYFTKLFKMFSRLQKNKDYEGTGLGLSLCKKIVNNMNGEISVKSTPGKGSTFHVDIPSDLFVANAPLAELAIN